MENGCSYSIFIFHSHRKMKITVCTRTQIILCLVRFGCIRSPDVFCSRTSLNRRLVAARWATKTAVATNYGSSHGDGRGKRPRRKVRDDPAASPGPGRDTHRRKDGWPQCFPVRRGYLLIYSGVCWNQKLTNPASVSRSSTALLHDSYWVTKLAHNPLGRYTVDLYFNFNF